MSVADEIVVILPKPSNNKYYYGKTNKDGDIEIWCKHYTRKRFFRGAQNREDLTEIIQQTLQRLEYLENLVKIEKIWREIPRDEPNSS